MNKSIIIIFCIAAVIVAALYFALFVLVRVIDAAEAAELEEMKDCEGYRECDVK